MKLSTEQNKALQGLSLQQKLDQLKSWFDAGEIKKEQLRYFSNRLIRKSHKSSTVSQQPRHYKTVFETTAQKLIDKFQHNIKHYVAYRNKVAVMLKPDEIKTVEGLLKNYRLLPVLDEFLVISMRYPDKRLNEMAVEYVEKWRMGSLTFWSRLWSDENLVPMDAIRLMLEDGKIKKCFTKETLSYLLPLIEAQRDKEIQRLEWAEAVGFTDTKAHRNRRLEAFNQLLSAVKI